MSLDPDLAKHEPALARQPIFNLPRIVIGFMVLCAVVHLLRTYGLTDEQDYELILRGAFIPLRYHGEFQFDLYAYTSPFTSSFIHGGWTHLILNMVWLAAFGSPLATRIGAFRFILFWAFATAASLLLHYLARPDDIVPVIGASGAISGMMGAAARYGFRIDRAARLPIFAGRRLTLVETLRTRQVIVFLSIWAVINVAAGLGFDGTGEAGSIAWEAHIGGMIAGLLGIGLFDRRPVRVD